MKKDIEKLIARKKLAKKLKPNLSYAGILDLIKIFLLSLIVFKLYKEEILNLTNLLISHIM